MNRLRIELDKYELKSFEPGDLFEKRTENGSDFLVYARTGIKEFALISLLDGNRLREPTDSKQLNDLILDTPSLVFLGRGLTITVGNK